MLPFCPRMDTTRDQPADQVDISINLSVYHARLDCARPREELYNSFLLIFTKYIYNYKPVKNNIFNSQSLMYKS